MELSKKTIVMISALAIGGTTLVVNCTSAQAAGISAGRAVVHIDARSATVTKQPDGTYSIAMPKGSSGQWMGERVNANGKKKVRVGILTGEDLASGWKKFGYTSSGVHGTLVWEPSCDQYEFAIVQVVGKPERTPTGLVFTVTSPKTLPASNMRNVSLHLDRAPDHTSRDPALTKSTSTTQNANVVDNLWISSTTDLSEETASFTMSIYDSSSSSTCWSQSWDVSRLDSKLTASAVGTCDNIEYSNYASNPAYGASATPTNGSTLFNLIVTPPNEAGYHYSYGF